MTILSKATLTLCFATGLILSPVVQADILPVGVTSPISVATEQEAKQFPDPQKTYVDAIQRYDVSQLKKLGLGINKNQVRFILGNPHFSEGLFAVHTWNYLIGLKKPDSNEYQLCQLRIDFDKDYLVNSMKWRDASCQDLINPAVVPQTQPVAPVPQSYVLNNVLFNFNKSGSKDVVGGQAIFDQIAADVHAKFKTIQSIHVTGFADHVGRKDYNESLSQARARTVANELITRGVAKADQVMVDAQGSTAAFAHCTEQAATPDVIHCLEPNRRVEIRVVGY